jgi:hypothetical protein
MPMKNIIVAENPFEPTSWESNEAEDLIEFLQKRFEKFPATARIYHNHVAKACDVTPGDDQSAEKLRELEGTFYIVVYPGDPLTITLIIITVIAVTAAIVMAILFKPPDPSKARTSSTNDLSSRANRERLYGRIPDIFGTVRCTPDLIAVPRTVYENHQEIEYCYMCIGRGSFDISSVYDGETPLEEIAGACAKFYGPHKHPNNSSPDLVVGTPVIEPLFSVKRHAAVNGQELIADNSNRFTGSNNVYFVNTGEIRLNPGDKADFTDHFIAGQAIHISKAAEWEPAQKRVVRFASDGPGQACYFYFPNNDAPFALPDTTIAFSSTGFSLYNPKTGTTNNVNLDYNYTVVTRTAGLITVQAPVNLPPYTYVTPWGQTVTIPSADIEGNWAFVYALNTYLAQIDGEGNYTRIPVKYITENNDCTYGSQIWSVDGAYKILAVSEKTIVLVNPTAVSQGWNNFGGTQTTYLSPVIQSLGPNWIGPAIVDHPEATFYDLNFVAPGGLFHLDEDGKQHRVNYEIEVQFQAIDSNGIPVNGPGMNQLFTSTIQGSASVRSQRALTMRCSTGAFGYRVRVQARRKTPFKSEKGSTVQTIKWKDLYSLLLVPAITDFGDVTTVFTSTYATLGALSVKDRRLNMLTNRMLPARIGSTSTFTSQLYASSSVADAFCFICLDPYIGRRTITELDVSNIYSTVVAINAYFGTALASEFSYAFDKDDQSFEDMIAIIANAIFCTAYRRGSLIQLSLERATSNSVLLFNHRNKMPGSETRTIRFGNLNDFDGVEVTYVDPDDESFVKYILPLNGTTINPKKVEANGVRNKLHAYFLAWRIWNKIRYQNIITEFEATQEAQILILQDRILVADNTRPETQDGEVLLQNILQLKLSQRVIFEVGVNYTIYLQHIDGSVEAIPITAGPTLDTVILGFAPRLPLAVDPTLYSKSVYQIVGDNDTRERAFLLTEKEPRDNYTITLRAVNYDGRYYGNDLDYINGIVSLSGNLI